MAHTPSSLILLRPGRPRGGFTIIELLIVITILGILAAITIPHFASASRLTRENALKDDLRYVRMQIALFRAQHRDVPPGYPSGNTLQTPTEREFVGQLSQFTDEYCGVSATAGSAHPLGPYLPKNGEMIANPMNGHSSVLVIASGQALPDPTGEYGWIYRPSTGEFIADLTGADLDGKAYAQN